MFTELKLKQAFPEDLKDTSEGVVKIRSNFSIYLLDPKTNTLSGPILLSINMNLDRLKEYLNQGLIYIPEAFYKDIPKIWADVDKEY